MGCLNLTLNAARSRGAGGPGPMVPTILRTSPQKPLTFESLEALARHVHRQRGRRGLQFARTVASYGGSDTFEAITVRWLYEDSDEYAFTVAIQGRSIERLQAALEAANPDIPPTGDSRSQRDVA